MHFYSKEYRNPSQRPSSRLTQHVVHRIHIPVPYIYKYICTPVPYLWKVLAIRTADCTVKALGFLFRASSSSPIPSSLRYRFLFFSAFGPLCFARCFFFSFSFSSISPLGSSPLAAGSCARRRKRSHYPTCSSAAPPPPRQRHGARSRRRPPPVPPVPPGHPRPPPAPGVPGSAAPTCPLPPLPAPRCRVPSPPKAAAEPRVPGCQRSPFAVAPWGGRGDRETCRPGGQG